ncbi:MAG: serine/threonine protein kinase [Marmoricola sp.]
MGDGLEPGASIGQYTIEDELGRGPLGISYRARDASGDLVALKVLASSAPLTDSEKARIARDFHSLEDLQSPQIPVLLEFVRYDHRYVIATDFLPLGNLAARLERGPLPLPAAITLIRHLTYAVGRAHLVGVVHGGIKPSNVLRREVNGRPVPVLGDFGGALRTHPWITPEHAADAPAYRAPELPAGQPTAASDVYSLGVLLSATTGPDAPEPVQRVIAHATQQDPARRFRTAHEMFTALTDIDSTALVQAAPAPATPPPAADVAPEGEGAVAAPVDEIPVAVAAQAPSERKRFITPEEIAAADRGYRSKAPFIAGGVIVAAVAAIVLTVVLSGNKGSVFTGKTTPPTPPAATAKAGYRSVLFTLSQPVGDASVVEVKDGTSWTQVGGTSYTLPTVVGGTRACATFRVADESSNPATYSTLTTACGTSLPPTLTVKLDRADCKVAGYLQVCYTFLASGLRPGTTHTLTLRLNGQVLGTRRITVDKSGHASLPDHEHFHFEAMTGGGRASVTYAGLRATWIVSNV